MGLRRRVYAFVLVAIYMVASIGSHFSILICDHHHHHHAEEHAEHNHAEMCSCEGLSFEAECCNHHHPILGENHTDYIASSQRYDSRDNESVLVLLMPALFQVVIPDTPMSPECDQTLLSGDEPWPLVAAYLSHESLRAPPVVA